MVIYVKYLLHFVKLMFTEAAAIYNFIWFKISRIHWMFVILLACIIIIRLLLIWIWKLLTIIVLNNGFCHVCLSVVLVKFHFHFFGLLYSILPRRFVHILLIALRVRGVSIIYVLICGLMCHDVNAFVSIQTRPLLIIDCRAVFCFQVCKCLLFSSLHKHLEIVWSVTVLVYSGRHLLVPIDTFE